MGGGNSFVRRQQQQQVSITSFPKFNLPFSTGSLCYLSSLAAEKACQRSSCCLCRVYRTSEEKGNSLFQSKPTLFCFQKISFNLSYPNLKGVEKFENKIIHHLKSLDFKELTSIYNQLLVRSLFESSSSIREKLKIFLSKFDLTELKK